MANHNATQQGMGHNQILGYMNNAMKGERRSCDKLRIFGTTYSRENRKPSHVLSGDNLLPCNMTTHSTQVTGPPGQIEVKIADTRFITCLD